MRRGEDAAPDLDGVGGEAARADRSAGQPDLTVGGAAAGDDAAHAARPGRLLVHRIRGGRAPHCASSRGDRKLHLPRRKERAAHAEQAHQDGRAVQASGGLPLRAHARGRVSEHVGRDILGWPAARARAGRALRRDGQPLPRERRRGRAQNRDAAAALRRPARDAELQAADGRGLHRAGAHLRGRRAAPTRLEGEAGGWRPHGL
mmetsp:Transcript_19344/g.48661  ORF Transcript_19344/g.48661 Transcript_19344/m.48661 type:complete len:204 (+) Transcript_19344:283-894(+)